jgi:hypothetical protein
VKADINGSADNLAGLIESLQRVEKAEVIEENIIPTAKTELRKESQLRGTTGDANDRNTYQSRVSKRDKGAERAP